jgi:hypothetical protein
MFFTDLAKLKTKPNNRENCVANYTKERIVFHIQNAENEFVALVSSSHALAFTSSVLTITSSSSSSVSVSVEESDSCADVSGSQPTNQCPISARWMLVIYRRLPGKILNRHLRARVPPRVPKLSKRPRSRVSSWTVPNLYLNRFRVPVAQMSS